MIVVFSVAILTCRQCNDIGRHVSFSPDWFFAVAIPDRIKVYFKSPLLNDEERNRIARLMVAICWMLLFGALGAAVFVAFTGFFVTVYTLLLGACLGAVCLILIRRQHLQLAAFLFFGGVISMLTHLLYVGEGVHSLAIMAYPLIIVVASLTLDWRGYSTVTVVTIVSIGWVVFGEVHGWIPGAYPNATSWIDFAILTTILIISAIGAHLTSADVRQNLIRARAELADRKRAEATSQYYAARMETLHEIDRAIISAESIEAIAQAALTRTQRLIPNRRAGVILFDSEANLATVVAYTIHGEIGQTQQRFPLDDFEIADELLHGQAHVVNDLRRLEFLSAAEQRLLDNGSRAYIDVPLMFHGLLAGALNLDTEQPDAFSPEVIEIVREVADQLAIALQNTRLLEQTQQHAQALEAHLLLHESVGPDCQLRLPRRQAPPVGAVRQPPHLAGVHERLARRGHRRRTDGFLLQLLCPDDGAPARDGVRSRRLRAAGLFPSRAAGLQHVRRGHFRDTCPKSGDRRDPFTSLCHPESGEFLRASYRWRQPAHPCCSGGCGSVILERPA